MKASFLNSYSHNRSSQRSSSIEDYKGEGSTSHGNENARRANPNFLTPKQHSFLKMLKGKLNVKLETYNMDGNLFIAEIRIQDSSQAMTIEMNRDNEEFHYFTIREGKKVRVEDTMTRFYKRIEEYLKTKMEKRAKAQAK